MPQVLVESRTSRGAQNQDQRRRVSHPGMSWYKRSSVRRETTPAKPQPSFAPPACPKRRPYSVARLECLPAGQRWRRPALAHGATSRALTPEWGGGYLLYRSTIEREHIDIAGACAPRMEGELTAIRRKFRGEIVAGIGRQLLRLSVWQPHPVQFGVATDI